MSREDAQYFSIKFFHFLISASNSARDYFPRNLASIYLYLEVLIDQTLIFAEVLRVEAQNSLYQLSR